MKSSEQILTGVYQNYAFLRQPFCEKNKRGQKVIYVTKSDVTKQNSVTVN